MSLRGLDLLIAYADENMVELEEVLDNIFNDF